LEAGALQHTTRLPVLPGRSPLLRLQGDEKLIAMTRKGQQAAFETLVDRYQSRLLAFCRHMLGSTEDAEDVLQEVFTAAFNAMLADERPINARPWLYRIARNRCLNHLRRPTASGQDSMDVFERDGGTTTADTVHKREEFRQIVADVQELPETQKTALLLREIDALSYEQIAEAMDTTVPSVKSLLVRARVSLGEAAEARLLSCGEVRLELGQVAEGLARTSAPVRRHLKGCERCRTFRAELRRTNRALASVYPIGPLVAIKLFVAKLGVGAASSGGSAAGGGIAASAGGAGATAGGATAGSALSAGMAGLASKAAAGIAAAAIVTAGAVEVREVAQHASERPSQQAAVSAVAPRPAQPAVATTTSEPKPAAVDIAVTSASAKDPAAAAEAPTTPTEPVTATVPVADPVTPTPAVTATVPETDTTATPPPAATQADGSTIVLTPGEPSGNDSGSDTGSGTGSPSGSGSGNGSTPPPSSPPGERVTGQAPQSAPAAGEPSGN
jgi:RNA polymerase sigma factor (sigma-70 family)